MWPGRGLEHTCGLAMERRDPAPCEVISNSLFGPAPASLRAAPDGLADRHRVLFGPGFNRSHRLRTAILTLPGQAPATIPDEPFRNGAGESVPPDGTYAQKMR